MAIHDGHFALVVGIDHYPEFRSLKGACNDAKDFHGWLISEDGGGLNEENTKLVLSTENPPRPIHDDIDDALLEILKKAKNVVVGGNVKRLYVYFSGHGLGRNNIGVDLCLARWSKWRRSMALDSEDYQQLVMGCGYFHEVIFFFDCCRVREVNTSALPSTIKLFAGDGAPACRSFIAYATEFMNAAHEAPAGQSNGSSDVRGHFTRALMDALKGAAAEPSGGVRASKLKTYLEYHTPLIAKASNHSQIPEVMNGLDGNDDTLFGNAKRPNQVANFAVNVVFKSFKDGEVVLEDGTLKVLKNGDASTGPWRISVIGRTMLLLRHLPTSIEKSIRIQGDEKEELYVEF